MELKDFKIGMEFRSASGKSWRCTDVGSRTAIAICLDNSEMTSFDTETKETTTKVMTRAEAERVGWLDGPPYGVVEHVFDEDELESLEPVAA
jgi:hypothetical protein